MEGIIRIKNRLKLLSSFLNSLSDRDFDIDNIKSSSNLEIIEVEVLTVLDLVINELHITKENLNTEYFDKIKEKLKIDEIR